MDRGGDARGGRRTLLRGVASLLGAALTVGLAAAPAWANPPGAPVAPTAVAGDSQITVTFSPPADDGGSTITSYRATCTSSDGGAPGTSFDAASPIVVTGLTNGNTYTCTVDATNGDGTSAESPPSDVVMPGSVPGAPAAPSVVAGNSLIAVTFSPPADDGGRTITSYTATCSGGMSPVSMSGPGSPISVTGLAKGTTYTCTVTATNVIGSGAASAPSDPVEVPATVPGAPPKPTAARGNRSLTVTFGAAAANGSPITTYTVTCSGGFVPVVASGAGSPIVVTGLANGTTYTCRVKATNSVGTGPQSHASLPVVPAAVPNAPARPTVTRGIGQIVVQFAVPANNGFAITRFTATCTSGNGVRGSRSGPHSPITVTGLTNGGTYACFVTATNSVGTGPRSVSSAPTIPGTAPAPPTLVSVISGRAPGPVGPLLVTFKPGADHGTPISSYRATCTPTRGGAAKVNTSTGSPITVPGLATAKPYSCRVVEITASGTSGPSGQMTTIVGTPAKPANVIIARHPHSVILTFAVPADNGNVIIHYHAACRSTNGGASASQFARGSPFTVNGLTPGGRYSCNLSAVNGRGEGPSTTVGPVQIPF